MSPGYSFIAIYLSVFVDGEHTRRAQTVHGFVLTRFSHVVIGQRWRVRPAELMARALHLVPNNREYRVDFATKAISKPRQKRILENGMARYTHPSISRFSSDIEPANCSPKPSLGPLLGTMAREYAGLNAPVSKPHLSSSILTSRLQLTKQSR